VSKTTERTPRAARADAQARPEAPPPTTATVGSAGTGVENTTCSWWKLFLMADCREKPGFPRRPRRRGGSLLGGVARPLPEEAAATTTLARGPAGSAAAAGATTRGAQHGGIAGPRSTKCPARPRTGPLSVYGARVGFLLFFGGVVFFSEKSFPRPEGAPFHLQPLNHVSRFVLTH
jgi:hypothetical protein